MDAALGLLARLIEALGGVVIGWAMLRALMAGGVLRFSNAGLRSMRQQLAGGVVSALGLVTAATLLKTITLRSWSAIGMFAVVLALRTLVKRALAAEVRSAPSQPLPAGPRESRSAPAANGPTCSRQSPIRG